MLEQLYENREESKKKKFDLGKLEADEIDDEIIGSDIRDAFKIMRKNSFTIVLYYLYIRKI